ncbi:hypothetical protein C8F04DRAFT_620448 [Mycena alexandri]|uniref:RxLR effector protein n=1 Tax=Mycena alexandri TaxID=1745969 RepID=A0AAD6SVQ5_9AGAR|nr:hypothetical protein C8F04DRAFT_620448 [Mycena alexandri]
MKLNISFPGLIILLSAVLEAHAIAIARPPATIQSSGIDLNKRPRREDEAQNVGKRQIFFKHSIDDDQAGATQSVEKRQIFLKHYEDDEQVEDAPLDIGRRQIFLKHYKDED